jgi:hypothetical protein
MQFKFDSQTGSAYQGNVPLDRNGGASMEILMALSTKTIPIIDQQEVLDGLWRLYETLPSRLPEDQDNNKSLVNSLFKLLVTIDILTRWPGSSPFSIVQTLENGQSCTSDQLKEHRMDVIDAICNSFVDVLPGIDDDSDKISLLKDLLSDVESLNSTCFDESIDVASVLCLHVIPELVSRTFYFDCSLS